MTERHSEREGEEGCAPPVQSSEVTKNCICMPNSYMIYSQVQQVNTDIIISYVIAIYSKMEDGGKGRQPGSS